MGSISLTDRILGGLWGAIVGDALGVPVEFKSREELRINPITNMVGYGTHNQPPGTWSDDSSLMLCTIESLLNGYDLNDMAERFIRWAYDAYWTPHGEVFDIGLATNQSISRLKNGIDPIKAGGDGERDNGNGSLMRILPVALFFADKPADDVIKYAHDISALTHRHPRSLMACGFYCLMAVSLMKGYSREKAYGFAINETLKLNSNPDFSGEFGHFKRILTRSIYDLHEDEISSSGYVIHTLEASIWCLLKSGSYEEAVLKAVNLGEDTDTTGIVTGGLAGLYYGDGSIPEGWLKEIARKNDITNLFSGFVQNL